MCSFCVRVPSKFHCVGNKYIQKKRRLEYVVILPLKNGIAEYWGILRKQSKKRKLSIKLMSPNIHMSIGLCTILDWKAGSKTRAYNLG